MNTDSGMRMEDGAFKCTECQLNRHKCFLWKKLTDLRLSGCGKWYHQLSPLAINQGHSCPDHTCVSENTRDPVMKDIEKLMHC